VYRSTGKRAFDIVASSLLLIVFLPVFLVIAVLVFMKLGSPILFRQQRPGLGGRPFTLLKFRTMIGTEQAGLHDADRLTSFGRALRSSSLDEVPELWNVLKGDMSLVGPRPLLMEYLPLYSAEQSRRHEVRPGITGWAQINGRNESSWEKRFALDVWYVDHLSLLLDLRILARTVASVLTRAGISAEGHSTMPKFTGRSS
jgi:lipopolysaccharide/colanic/teichoic acid biosynthesis glycosyltransferase